MYERSFPAIGERFFKKTAWPTPDAIATYAENDPVFKMLYAELYYRHLHQATTPSANERKGSWENYCELFGALLHGDANMQLPNVWLYEMVDEFVYQFQSFRQFKGSSKRTSEELQAIKALDAQVWDRTSMLNFLKALADTNLRAVPERGQNVTRIKRVPFVRRKRNLSRALALEHAHDVALIHQRL